MPPWSDQLARLRVAVATGRLPADLGRWAVAELAARADADDRRELRDRLLVEAGRELVPDGSTWGRAVALSAELARVRPHHLVAAALEVDTETMPRSVRQLMRILTSGLSRCHQDSDQADE